MTKQFYVIPHHKVFVYGVHYTHMSILGNYDSNGVPVAIAIMQDTAVART